MPVTLHFYANGVNARHAGVVTDDQVLEAQRIIYDHDYPSGLQFKILDLTDVVAFQVTADTMRHIGSVDSAKARLLGSQLAVVVAPNEGRVQSVIWEAWAKVDEPGGSSLQTCIVRDLAAAEKWLRDQGVEPVD